MTMEKIVGNGRDSEGPMWKLIRLWPIVVGAAAVIGSIYVMSDNVGDLQTNAKIQWTKIGENRDAIKALESRNLIIDYRFDSIDQKIQEQKSDIKEILREVKK